MCFLVMELGDTEAFLSVNFRIKTIKYSEWFSELNTGEYIFFSVSIWYITKNNEFF